MYGRDNVNLAFSEDGLFSEHKGVVKILSLINFTMLHKYIKNAS